MGLLLASDFGLFSDRSREDLPWQKPGKATDHLALSTRGVQGRPVRPATSATLRAIGRQAIRRCRNQIPEWRDRMSLDCGACNR